MSTSTCNVSLIISFPLIFTILVLGTSLYEGKKAGSRYSRFICQTHWSHSTLDIASLLAKNEAGITAVPGTHFKRMNTTCEPQQGLRNLSKASVISIVNLLQFLLGFITILPGKPLILAPLFAGKEAVSCITRDQWSDVIKKHMQHFLNYLGFAKLSLYHEDIAGNFL